MEPEASQALKRKLLSWTFCPCPLLEQLASNCSTKGWQNLSNAGGSIWLWAQWCPNVSTSIERIDPATWPLTWFSLLKFISNCSSQHCKGSCIYFPPVSDIWNLIWRPTISQAVKTVKICFNRSSWSRDLLLKKQPTVHAWVVKFHLKQCSALWIFDFIVLIPGLVTVTTGGCSCNSYCWIWSELLDQHL